MAIDALTAQLLTGGGAGGGGGIPLGVVDPALAAVTPEIQLGQQMVQQGVSTAPAYPGAALARALQGAIGASLQKSGYSDLANAYANSLPALQHIFPKGSPIGDALASGNPLAISLALKNVGPAMLVNTEKQKLGPNDVSVVGSNTTATGSPAQAGATTAAETKAAAPYKPAGTTVVGGVERPISEADLARHPVDAAAPPQVAPARPSIPQITPSPSPSAAVTPPANPQFATPTEPQKDQSRVTQAQPTFGKTPAYEGQVEGAKDAAKADVEFSSFRGGQQGPTGGPGISVPMPTDHGTQIPPVNAQATVPSDPGVIKEKLPAWQKTITDFSTSLAPAQLADQRLSTIAKAYKAIETGTFTTQKAELAAAFKAANLPVPNFLGDPAQVQLALHENYAETMNQLKAATSRFTQQEFRITSENKEHPNIQPEANLQMLAEDKGTLKQQIDLANDWNQASRNGWKDPQSYQTEFLKLNPLPDYVAREKQSIGPLKGMGTKQPAQQAATPVHSPAEIQAEMRRRGLIQ